MSRFVLLRHDCPPDYRDGPHWDLMIERPDVEAEHRLATWSLLALPRGWPDRIGREAPIAGRECRVLQLRDHRAAYLDYEGPVSGNRGEVARWARGQAVWIGATDGHLTVELEQSALAGVLSLDRRSGDEWILAWKPDGRAAS